MNKKHLLFFLFQAVCVIAMTASCTGGAKGESPAPMAIDSVSVEETDTTPPMFADYCYIISLHIIISRSE